MVWTRPSSWRYSHGARLTSTTRFAGTAIHRIGYERWSRNLAVGLGNARTSERVLTALAARTDDPSALVREHVVWALAQHGARES